MVRKRWLDELARDLVALGGIPFLILTIVRVSVTKPYYPMQFIISSIVFFILKAVFGGTLRAGIGLILLVFTSLFYNSWLFAIFALLIYTGLIISSFYLKEEKKEILKGILLGGISTAIGYLTVRLLFYT
jgi:uncharacterized membrane protein YqjE